MNGGRRAPASRPWLTVLLAVWAVAATALSLRLGHQLLETAEGTREDLPLEAAPPVSPPPPAPPEPEDRLVLEPAAVEALPGWPLDRVADTLPALLRSCKAFAAVPDERPLGPGGIAGTAADWRGPCAAARRLDPEDHDAARAFLARDFHAWALLNREQDTGLATGYYEPALRGSRRRHGPYQIPLYRRPPDLVGVDLGAFRTELAGKSIAGRWTGRSFAPYPDRAALDGGELAGRGLELVWVDDPVDAFFLHIQGSGRVELAEGGVLRVGYAAQNGHAYTAIGRELIDRGELEREAVSMQSIRRWLAANQKAATEILHTNPSYVFFRELAGEGPLGSQGVALTPGRSLAVDRRHLPMGVPVWVAGQAPSFRPGTGDVPLERLTVAQDTGGAIRGPLRADLFWGHGEAAAEVAGRMKHPVRLWLLLPRTVEPEAARRAGGGDGLAP